MSHFYRQVQDHTAKFSAWLFALTFFFTFLTAASAFAQEAPEITADAAIVVDADTGKTLFEKNANKPEYPASMTKVMTAVRCRTVTAISCMTTMMMNPKTFKQSSTA